MRSFLSSVRTLATASLPIALIAVSAFGQSFNNGDSDARTIFPADFAARDILTSVSPYERIERLEELSSDTEGGAYPWISPDGLRLYYTPINRIHGINVATRVSVRAPFGEPVPMQLDELGFETISCWLTPDERTAYVFVRKNDSVVVGDQSRVVLESASDDAEARRPYYLQASDSLHQRRPVRQRNPRLRPTSLYRLERNSITEEFADPKRITLRGEIQGFLSGASMTADGQTLFVYCAGDTEEFGPEESHIVEFNRVDDTTFELNRRLPVPEEAKLSPGSISADGLRLYMSVEDEDGRDALAYYQRSSIADPFEQITMWKNDQDGSILEGHQPSVSADGTVMVFVTSPIDLWSENRLHVGHAPKAAAAPTDATPGERMIVSARVAASPGRVYVELRETDALSRTISLFDAQGIAVRELQAEPGHNRIEMDVADLPSGAYFCSYTDSEQHRDARKLVIVR